MRRSIGIATALVLAWVQAESTAAPDADLVKIRHFGLLASSNVSTMLERARALLPSTPTNDDASLDHRDGNTRSSASEIDATLPWPMLPATHHRARAAAAGACLAT